MSGALEKFQVFEASPEPISQGKSHQFLCRSDILNGSVQVVADGGENNLHAHTASDEIWLVLDGEVAFYTEEEQEVARLGPRGGLLIPRGTPYWFASTGETPLVIMRFGAKAQGVKEERIDYTPPSETIRTLLAQVRETTGGS
jgi:mannose-6-phosphate isomerase-like protein (cupin superfamily)